MNMTPEELEIKRERRREACLRYRMRYPERRKEQYRISNKKRYASNRTMYLANAKIYRENNREKLAARAKAIREQNPDLFRHRKRKYYNENKERIRTYQRTDASRYKTAVSLAFKRGIEWSISESDYFEFISKRCHYRNHPLDKTGVGLDRIENSKGYTVGNVVPCCGFCNRIKCHLLTYKEMVAVGKLLDEMSIQKATEGVTPWR